MTNKQKQQKFLKYFTLADIILELGRGWRDFLELYEENKIYAIGVYKNYGILIKKFKNSKYIKIKIGDIREILYRLNKDVYSGVYLRHIFYSQIIKFLRRLYKTLKKNCKIVIIFPYIRNYNVFTYEFWNDIIHVRPYTYEIIEKLLNQENLKIIESSPAFESWDNSFIKDLIRKMRSLIIWNKAISLILLYCCKKYYYIVAKNSE